MKGVVVLITKIKGLKFPDEAVTRFFFKQGFHNVKGSALELGCGSGNNLRLFYEYGWDVTGVDLSSDAVSDATENLTSIQIEYRLNNKFHIIKDDMLNFIRTQPPNSIGVILFPSSLFYLKYDEIIALLELVSKALQSGAFLFFKLVTDMDYRFLNPNKINLGNCSYKLKFEETDEYNQVVTFLSREQWVDLIKKYFNFKNFSVFDLIFDHTQNSVITKNANIICYGELI
jgi:SAM-dependent methyltransferase